MTVFTDITAAIEEALYIKKTEFRHQKVVQKKDGTVTVTQCKGNYKQHTMYSTRSPC